MNIDDDHNHHHHHHIDIETNEVKVVSRRWCVTYDEDDGGYQHQT